MRVCMSLFLHPKLLLKYQVILKRHELRRIVTSTPDLYDLTKCVDTLQLLDSKPLRAIDISYI